MMILITMEAIEQTSNVDDISAWSIYLRIAGVNITINHQNACINGLNRSGMVFNQLY